MVLPIDDPEFIALIEKGIPIEDLEKRLRPKLRDVDYEEDVRLHAGFADSSDEGFIGQNENLIELVYSDFETVEKYGTTHSQIADRLNELIKIGSSELSDMRESSHSLQYKIFESLPDRLKKYVKGILGVRDFTDESSYAKNILSNGYSFMLPFLATCGTQSCPWSCNYRGQNAGTIHITNLTEDEKMLCRFSQAGGIESMSNAIEHIEANFDEDSKPLKDLRRVKDLSEVERGRFYAPLTHLLPHLIRDHYFFEGRESPYRADPEFLIKSLGLAK